MWAKTGEFSRKASAKKADVPSLRRHNPDQVRRVQQSPSQPKLGAPRNVRIVALSGGRRQGVEMNGRGNLVPSLPNILIKGSQ